MLHPAVTVCVCVQARKAEHESQQHMRSLNRLLRKIKTDMSSADKMAAQQLTAATDQLSSLHSTVHRIDMKTQVASTLFLSKVTPWRPSPTLGLLGSALRKQ